MVNHVEKVNLKLDKIQKCMCLKLVIVLCS